MFNSTGLALCELHKDYLNVSSPYTREAIVKEMATCLNTTFHPAILNYSVEEFEQVLSLFSAFTLSEEEASLENFRNLLKERDFHFVKACFNSDGNVVLQCCIGQELCKLHEAFGIDLTKASDEVKSYVNLVGKKAINDYVNKTSPRFTKSAWFTILTIDDAYLDVQSNKYLINANFIFSPQILKQKDLVEEISEFLWSMPTEINP